jgi:hypothetical protein
MANGVVYALSHRAWIDELILSVRTCRSVMPDLERELYAPPNILAAVGDRGASLFTKIVKLSELRHKQRPRFESMLLTELEGAIFIDTDTYFVEPVYELFEILKHYDIAAYPAPQSKHPNVLKTGVDKMLPAVSAALPEWNGGVIVARVDDDFKEFVNMWSGFFTTCEENGHKMDQFAFRIAMAQTKLRVATLPNNYNFRAHIPNLVTKKIKIVHAHGELEKIAKIVNKENGMRLYLPNPDLISGLRPKGMVLPK